MNPPSRTRRLVSSFALRLVVSAAILLTLGHVFAVPLVAPLLPAFSEVIEAADGRFRVDDIALDKSGARIELKATPVRVLILGGGRLLMPRPELQFKPNALMGSVLQPIILFLAIILAWPPGVPWALPLRLLLALPAIAVLLVVNVPLGLVGVLLDFRPVFPDAPVHPLVYWNDFLQNGGPLVLAVAAAALVISGADALARRWGLQRVEKF